MKERVFVADCRYIEEIRHVFGDCGYFVPSVPCSSLAEPVACHPDMALYALEDGTVICAPEVYHAYRRLLSPFGINLVQGRTGLHRDYPKDIAYNVLNADGFAFARWAGTEPQIVDGLDRQNIRRLPVAQGYARCSALAVGSGVITADPSIAKAAACAGLDLLRIRPGHIRLPGYDYGFIGGASGLLDRDTVGVFGDLSLHPDGETIRGFVQDHGFALREAPGRPLCDIGTILSVKPV